MEFFFFFLRVRLLLLEELDYDTTGLNCYVKFCRVFVVLLGPCTTPDKLLILTSFLYITEGHVSVTFKIFRETNTLLNFLLKYE